MTVRELCADLHSVVPGRKLDDDGTVLLRFDNGASGVLMASQICIGDENNLRLRIYGEKASIDWQQMEPNSLWLQATGSARATAAHRRGRHRRGGRGGRAHSRGPSGGIYRGLRQHLSRVRRS